MDAPSIRRGGAVIVVRCGMDAHLSWVVGVQAIVTANTESLSTWLAGAYVS